jgi:hypothetical protein
MQPQCADDMCHHQVEWRCARKRCARFAWFSYSTSSKKVRALAYHNDDSRKQSLGDDSTSRNFHSGCQCAFPMWLMNWEQAADDRSAVADKTDTAK